jgi:hypothetical protein
VPLVPTRVDLEGPFVYARVEPLLRARAEAPRPLRSKPAIEDRGVPEARGGRVLSWIGPRAVVPRSAAARRLVELGLASSTDLLVGGSASEMLEHAGRVERVPTEVLAGEARLDRVAMRLAELAEGALGAVAFEQIAMDSWESGDGDEGLEVSGERPLGAHELDEPGEDEPRRISSLPDEPDVDPDSPLVGLRRLRAVHEDAKGVAAWEVLALDRGPWLDLPAVLGLLNAMLRHAGSETRFVVLRGDSAEARVIAGPERGLSAAIEEGLVELEGPDDALLRSFDGDDAELADPS